MLGPLFLLLLWLVALGDHEARYYGDNEHFMRCCLACQRYCYAVPMRGRPKVDSILPRVLCGFKEVEIYQIGRRGCTIPGAYSLAFCMANAKR